MRVLVVWWAAAMAAAGEPGAVEPPVALDERLTVELFAAEPDLVTPTGIAVDLSGRVLVIESHTHFRPDGYAGPPADRIRVFEDTTGDGRADRAGTFFEGTEATMNLAVYRDGSVYVATRNEIFRLGDADGDGRADERTPIARLQTPGDYPHNGLSGFAFDFAGDVYFGLGENLGAEYQLIGSDGAVLAGGGEGGSIYRCRPDGGGLARVATGFWNPFHLSIDAYGRLFAVDNDPDSRPPCRLLHIVPQGDYGYRFRNGRKGLHPFTAWNGELAGTLPMVAGTGEAPSGVVAYESDGLPGDYRGNLLVTSWGDHRLERHRLEPRGASFGATAEPFVSGGENFRPVGIAVAPDGSLLVSDWVDKSYELHGKGRIWHVRSKEPAEAGRPTEPREAVASAHRDLRERAARELAAQGSAGLQFLQRLTTESCDPRVRAVALQAIVGAGGRCDAAWQLANADPSHDVRELAVRVLPARDVDPLLAVSTVPAAVRAEALRRIDEILLAGDGLWYRLVPPALCDGDPFLRHAALAGTRRAKGVDYWLLLAGDENPAHRLAGLLLLRGVDDPGARETLPRFLDDPDPRIRFAAVQWVAESQLAQYRPQVEALLAQGATSRQLFEGCLSALERLDPQAPPRAPGDEIAAEEYVAQVFLNPQTPVNVRRRALRVLRPDHPAISQALLGELLAISDLGTKLEAVRTLRDRPAEATELLEAIAFGPDYPTAVRAEAIVGLAAQDRGQVEQLLSLALAGDEALSHEALRSLRGAPLNADERDRLGKLAQTGPAAAELVGRILDPAAAAERPAAADLEAWLKLVDGLADPRAGERVYFHPKSAGCYRCHEIDGRGGRIGPDLSSTARVLTRRRLVESILEPSKEIAPGFVSWVVTKADGSIVTGLLVGQSAGGEQTYANERGELVVLAAGQIAERHPLETSIMPDSLIGTLTLQEFRDLVAYLVEPR